MPYTNPADEIERGARRRLRPANIAYMKEYREKNKPKLAAWARDWRKRTRGSRVRELMLNAARVRARMRSLPINIGLDDIVIPEICPVLGIPLAKSKTNRACRNSPSLDRLIPSLGYVKGNVRVISQRANALKSDATIEELEAVLSYMRETNPRADK